MKEITKISIRSNPFYPSYRNMSLGFWSCVSKLQFRNLKAQLTQITKSFFKKIFRDFCLKILQKEHFFNSTGTALYRNCVCVILDHLQTSLSTTLSSHCALWIIQNNQDSFLGRQVEFFKCHLSFQRHELSCIHHHCTGLEAEISEVDISKFWHMKLKLSAQPDNTEATKCFMSFRWTDTWKISGSFKNVNTARISV